MRRKERIAPFLDKLSALCAQKPDVPVAEILSLAQTAKQSDLFYMEDDMFLQFLENDVLVATTNTTAEVPDGMFSVMQAIYSLWIQVPDWRFMQLMCNLGIPGCGLSDVELCSALRKQLNEPPASTQRYQVVELFDKQVLDLDERYDQTAREALSRLYQNTLYFYDIQHDADQSGEWVQVKPSVTVNYWTTICSDEPIESQSIEEDDWGYTEESMSLDEYLSRKRD